MARDKIIVNTYHNKPNIADKSLPSPTLLTAMDPEVFLPRYLFSSSSVLKQSYICQDDVQTQGPPSPASEAYDPPRNTTPSYFSTLSSEIRSKIWVIASNVSRKVYLPSSSQPMSTYSDIWHAQCASTTTHSAILHCTKESRAEAKNAYRLYDHIKNFLSPYSLWNPNEARKIYVNFASDIFIHPMFLGGHMMLQPNEMSSNMPMHD